MCPTTVTESCSELRIWSLNRFSVLQLKLMTSWAVVCDVYFLPPQMRADGETAQQFAERCQVTHPL